MHNKSKRKYESKIDKIKISKLEEVIINFATPFDALFRRCFQNTFESLDFPNKRYNDYLQEISEIKNDYYKRLIYYKTEGIREYKQIDEYFEVSPCGLAMVITYEFIRDDNLKNNFIKKPKVNKRDNAE